IACFELLVTTMRNTVGIFPAVTPAAYGVGVNSPTIETEMETPSSYVTTSPKDLMRGDASGSDASGSSAVGIGAADAAGSDFATAPVMHPDIRSASRVRATRTSRIGMIYDDLRLRVTMVISCPFKTEMGLF